MSLPATPFMTHGFRWACRWEVTIIAEVLVR
jgi:hypothetical protein